MSIIIDGEPHVADATVVDIIHELRQRLAASRAEVELERMRLAACGVAAQSNLPGRLNRITPDNPYYSASYSDVCHAVDREMAHRADVERLRGELERIATRANYTKPSARTIARAALSAQPAPLSNCACGKPATMNFADIPMCAECRVKISEAMERRDKDVLRILDKAAQPALVATSRCAGAMPNPERIELSAEELQQSAPARPGEAFGGSAAMTKLDRFGRAFSSNSGGCRRTCECGREFYNPTGGWDWEEGELERLDKGMATPLDWTVGTIILEGHEFVEDCDCWHPRAEKVMAFLDSHADQIAAYLNCEKATAKAEAERMPEACTCRIEQTEPTPTCPVHGGERKPAPEKPAQPAGGRAMNERDAIAAYHEQLVRANRAEAENAKLRAEVGRLVAALLRYGCHDGGTLDAAAKDCRCLNDGPDTCDCGLDEALARKES